MKRIAKLRLYYAASSSFILAFIPTFILLTFFAKTVAVNKDSSVLDLTVYAICFVIITVLIYKSDSEFQIYYCKDCRHEWPKKKHKDEVCQRCGSKNWVYNYKP